MPRSYDQYCSLARAFEVLGDRWAPLVVRELMLGPRRYSDLARDLAGVASDILTRRLRDLETAGVVRRRELDPPAGGSVYELTDRGERLREPMLALGRWGVELLEAPAQPEVFKGSLLANAAQIMLRPPEGEELEVQLVADGDPFVIRISGGRVRSRRGRAADPVVTLEGRAGALAAVLAAGQEPGSAGVEVLGDPDALDRLRAMTEVPAELTPPAV